MSTAVLEIVDLGDGEIVLRRSEGDRDALVRISFSEEAQLYLSDNELEVARAMIQAGLQAVARINEEPAEELPGNVRILH